MTALSGGDWNEIAPGLWQGGLPPHGDTLRRAGFDAVVLSAVESQPPPSAFPGVTTIYVPFEDEDITPEIWKRATFAAEQVSKLRATGQRVLVTCWSGWNRSGLISALSLMMLDGMTGPQAVARVRSKRRHALCNETFAAALKRAR